MSPTYINGVQQTESRVHVVAREGTIALAVEQIRNGPQPVAPSSPEEPREGTIASAQQAAIERIKKGPQ